MSVDRFWGEDLPPVSNEELDENTAVMKAACESNPAFEVVGQYRTATGIILLAVDVSDGTYALDNGAGIRRRERLGICYTEGHVLPWRVFALREDFPPTLHQNQEPKGHPRSLCLYNQPWADVERNWTPEKFLNRILWWLRGTADGTLHPDDQALEGLFFESEDQLILPPGLFEDGEDPQNRLVLSRVAVARQSSVRTIFVGNYKEKDGGDGEVECAPLFIVAEPVDTVIIRDYPRSLGELDDRLRSTGTDFVPQLKKQIARYIGSGRRLRSDDTVTYVVVTVTPRRRNGVIERLELHGFGLTEDLVRLGVGLGILIQGDRPPYHWHIDGMANMDGATMNAGWRDIELSPISVQQFPGPREVRRFSGMSDDDTIQGVIAGLGALGSAIAAIWAREAWGDWHYVDPDRVEPHNLVRHLADFQAVGHPKSTVVALMTGNLHAPANPGRPEVNRYFHMDILAPDASLQDTVRGKDLLVDVTTTVRVPRTLSMRDGPRIVSAFFTPSGRAAVMLMESADRKTRAMDLEAQYYRAILTCSWGSEHLSTGGKHIIYGRGCRDMTLPLSQELVSHHAATLARRIRIAAASPDASIGVWTLDDRTGALKAHIEPAHASRHLRIGGWTVVIDAGLESGIKRMRSQALPNETGGILLGVIDHKDKVVLVVSATPEPLGSRGSPSGFARADAEKEHAEAQRRTGGMVGYIGEWHSHPVGSEAKPSDFDAYQIAHVGGIMGAEGDPTLMVIAAEDAIGISLHPPVSGHSLTQVHHHVVSWSGGTG